VSERAPHPELLSSLGRLVRGLSALFWGLPIALVVCVQTAKGDWLKPLGILPPIIATALLVYGLGMLGHFQKQERIWRSALERARIPGLINLGLSPFLFWWNQLPSNPFYDSIIHVMVVTGLLFLLALNPVLWRLAAMLPDETLRQETRLFTAVNRYLLCITLGLLAGYFFLFKMGQVSTPFYYRYFLEWAGMWLVLFLVLVPVAMTMAMTWKIKEVILDSVFGPTS